MRIVATKPGDAQKSAFDPYGALSQISARYGAPVRGGELRIPCTAHGGTNRTSLSLSVSASGKVLAICHSEGCSFEEIRDALERDSGVRISGPAKPDMPDPRSGGIKGDSFVEHRYVYSRGPERVTHVDRRHSGPCGREDCSKTGAHKHEWREPAGLGGDGWELLFHPPSETLPNTPPVIAEGEKTCAAVAAVGYPGYSYLGGASGAGKADYSLLAGAPLVLVAPDRDRTGRAAALRSVLALLSLDPPVRTVRVLDSRLLPAFRGADLADVGPERRTELLRAVSSGASCSEYSSLAAPALALSELEYRTRVSRLPQSALPRFPVSKENELREFSDDVWSAIIRGVCSPGSEKLFRRGGKELVEVRFRLGKMLRNGEWSNRDYILPVKVYRFGALSSEAVWWHKGEPEFTPLCSFDGSDQGESEMLEAAAALGSAEALPHSWPGWYANTKARSKSNRGLQYGIWAYTPHWPAKEGLEYLVSSVPDEVPVLDRVLHAPALDPDGRGLLSGPGYHPSIAAWIADDGAVDLGALPPVGECLERIWEVFGEFPFATESSRANFLALLIAGIIGPACGPKPAFLGDKPAAGTGATLMMRTAAFLVGGMEPHWITARSGRESASDAELEKSLVTAALSGNPFALLDNATGRLDSPVWNTYVTAEEWSARRLGVNESVPFDRTTLVDMVTGNNLLTTEESERRILPIYLDSRVPTPSARVFSFNPKRRVLGDRPRYLEAVAGLVAHWIRAGRPPGPQLESFGSFEEWRDITSGVLHAAGVEGFGGETGRSRSVRLIDDGTGEFVQSWWDSYGTERVTGKALRGCSPPIDSEGPRTIGAYLQRLAGRIFNVSGDGELFSVQVSQSGLDKHGTRIYVLSPL